jgi:hypothetical protein
VWRRDAGSTLLASPFSRLSILFQGEPMDLILGGRSSTAFKDSLEVLMDSCAKRRYFIHSPLLCHILTTAIKWEHLGVYYILSTWSMVAGFSEEKALMYGREGTKH